LSFVGRSYISSDKLALSNDLNGLCSITDLVSELHEVNFGGTSQKLLGFKRGVREFRAQEEPRRHARPL
jgi:hypothetical protein